MVKSKRAQVISLTKVKRKDKTRKEGILNELRDVLDVNSRVFVYEVENDKAVHMQYVRTALKPGRMFYGKNKLMIKALGNTEETEVAENIHHLCNYLSGHRGLICTNSDERSIRKIFESCQPEEPAKSGFIATETVVLKEGTEALAQFPHSMEPQLRKLGLPTLLKSGSIYLMGDTPVCTKGVPLTVEAAQLLKLLGYRMAKFRMKLVASWEKDTGKIREF